MLNPGDVFVLRDAFHSNALVCLAIVSGTDWWDKDEQTLIYTDGECVFGVRVYDNLTVGLRSFQTGKCATCVLM